MPIRPANSDDTQAITSLYNHYIANTVITFEEVLVDTETMQSRITDTQENFPYLVYEKGGQVMAYAYATQWRERSAYLHSVETTIYCHKDLGGQGIGTVLYTALIEELKKRSFKTAIGGIALPNPASIALHEKLGFEKVAQFEQVGFKFERWVDVAYWQLML